MIKITLDTNCVINILDRTSKSATSVEEITEIIRYGLESNVNIAITTRVEEDLSKDKDEKRKEELIRRLSMFPIIGTITRLGVSKFGSGDFLGADSELDNQLTKIIFPNLKKDDVHYDNKITDIDHLVGHILNKRDIFVTDDTDILKKAEVLKNSPGIMVMNPKKCLEYINLNANKTILVQEFYEKLKEYRDLLIAAQEEENYIEKQQDFIVLREWLLKKYPIIKSGLLQFKLNMMSVPAGPGQMFCDPGNMLGLENMNERIQIVFVEPSLEQQIETILKPQSDHEGFYPNPRHNTPKAKMMDRFQDILDLLLSYCGYLESNF